MRKRNGSLKFKRGNAVIDSFLVLIIIIVFSMMSIISFKALSDLNTDMQVDDDLSNTTKEVMSDATAYYPSLFDNAVVMILIFFWAMTIIASFMVDSHPIFFIFSIILLVFILIAVAFISNAYFEVMSDSDLYSLSLQFPKTLYIIGHLVEIIMAISFSILITMFAKSRME